MVLHQLVDVDGQVSTVEATNADMDDSLLDGGAARVGWDLDLAVTDLGDSLEVLGVELGGSHCEG